MIWCERQFPADQSCCARVHLITTSHPPASGNRILYPCLVPSLAGNVWQLSSFSPMLAVLIVIVLVLVIIAFVIVIVVKLRTGSNRIRKTRGKKPDSEGVS